MDSGPTLVAGSADDEGILQPMPELKVVIDKTAEFVAKSGRDLENRILISEASNPKFAFMRPGNVYYAYYQLKIRDFVKASMPVGEGSAGSVDMTAVAQEKLELRKKLLAGGNAEDAEESATTTKAAEASTAAARASLRRMGLLDSLASKLKITDAESSASPTTEKKWALDTPSLSAADLDIIKLTAQYVARNGRAFQMGLMNREARNPQFGFLIPGHPYNPFFTKLVEAYTAVLLPPRELIEQLRALAVDKEGLVRRVVSRALIQRSQVKSEEARQAAEEAEREAMSQIDWNDFVVVHTISFLEGETLPPCPDKSRIISSTLSADAEMEALAATISEPQPSESKPTPVVSSVVAESGSVITEDVASSSRLVSGAAASYRPPSAVKTTICPKCGQAIPLDEFSEHMKIELSGAGKILQGPGKKLDQRVVDSPYEESDRISQNLQRLAAKRTDIFGAEDDEEALLAKQRAEEETLRKLRESKSWDGHSSSVQRMAPAASGEAAPTSIYDQIAAIHQAKGLSRAPIGPADSMAGRAPPPQPPMGMSPVYPPYPGPPGMGMPPPHMGMPYMPYGGMMPMAPPQPVPGSVMPASDGTSRDAKRAAPFPPGDEPTSEPPSKRQKVEEPQPVLVEESEWLAKLGGPESEITLLIQCPQQQSEASSLTGQTEEVKIAAGQTVSALKSLLANRTGLAANKQNLRSPTSGFLKDKCTLAFYNLENGSDLVLSVKERGGRKK